MLVDPALSGLPAFLTPNPGLNSGFMLAQVTAAALVSENKQRAYPASVDSIPTSANQEDHVSMAAHAARRLLPMAENAFAIIGIEWLAAAQGCDFHAPMRSSDPLEAVARAAPPGSPPSRRRPLLSPRHCSGVPARARRRGRRGGRRASPPGSGRGAMSGKRPDWLEIRRGKAPLIVSIPHGGVELRDYEQRFVSPWIARKDADWRLDELYDFVGALGATLVRTSLSRSIIDVNRDPSGASLYPGQATTELCPTTTFDGEPLYRGTRPTRTKSPNAGGPTSTPITQRSAPRSPGSGRASTGLRCSMRTRSARAFRGCSTASCRCSISGRTAARAAARNCGKRSAPRSLRAGGVLSSMAASGAAGSPAAMESRGRGSRRSSSNSPAAAICSNPTSRRPPTGRNRSTTGAPPARERLCGACWRRSWRESRDRAACRLCWRSKAIRSRCRCCRLAAMTSPSRMIRGPAT